ncbi:MAG: hypothetical protein QXU62_07430 [Thermofilaceae archaeon]
MSSLSTCSEATRKELKGHVTLVGKADAVMDDGREATRKELKE